MSEHRMRGYFGVGVEGISKPMNVGAIMRTAHAFGASFVFTIGAVYAQREGGRADTSDAPGHLPLHEYDGLDDFSLPRGCGLVGVELTDDAVDLPSFRHPRQAAYAGSRAGFAVAGTGGTLRPCRQDSDTFLRQCRTGGGDRDV